jgi:hypothetical protein
VLCFSQDDRDLLRSHSPIVLGENTVGLMRRPTGSFESRSGWLTCMSTATPTPSGPRTRSRSICVAFATSLKLSGSLSHVAAAVLALLHVFCPFVSGTVPISCVLMAPLLAFLGLLPLPRLDLSWVRRDRSTEVLNFAQNSSSSLGFG